MNKIIKNIKLSWTWLGDIYLLKGFNIALTKEGQNPSINNLTNTLAYVSVLSPKEIIEKENDSSLVFSYTLYNQVFDDKTTIVPWVQALYDNDDSEWISLDGAIIEDDGNATIVVIGNPTFQQIIDMATDSKITPQEKLSLEKEWDEIITDHYMTLLSTVKAKLPSNHKDLMDYDNKIDSLAIYLNYNKDYIFHPINHEEYSYPKMITDKLTTDLDILHYGGYDKYKKVFNDFYEAKVKLLETIKEFILANNNDIIQEEIDKSNLPSTIPLGGYVNCSFDMNKDYLTQDALGFIKVGIGHFITTTGQKYKIDSTKEIVTDLNSNLARYKYILFIGADNKRFSYINENSSRHFVSAIHKAGKWFYFNRDDSNNNLLEFDPIPEDCVIAKIDEHSSISNGKGIRSIKFMATTQQSIFNQLTDCGEQQFIGKDDNGLLFINGEYIQAHSIKGHQVDARELIVHHEDDGIKTLEVTSKGDVNLNVKNFNLVSGGETNVASKDKIITQINANPEGIKIQGRNIDITGQVTFEGLDKDLQGNFTKNGNITSINGDKIKTGVITANNGISEYNLNDGTFRLGGTGPKDYKLFFDGTNLKFGNSGVELPDIELPNWVDDWTNNSTSINGQIMISPRIFAGIGGSSATGVALGRQALGTEDITSNIGMGIYGAGNLIGKIKSIPDSNGVVVEFGIGNSKMTIDKNGNVSVPKMSASEIVSSINGSSSTINGGNITTRSITSSQIKTGTITADQISARTITAAELSSNCIEARHIKTDSISVNSLSSNNANPILKLFPQPDGGYCSLDATYQYEQGKGSAIRLKWDSMNYVMQRKSGVSFYMEPRENGAAFDFESDYANGNETRILTKEGTLSFRGSGLYYNGAKLSTGSSTVSWSDIQNKPSRFRPENHSHSGDEWGHLFLGSLYANYIGYKDNLGNHYTLECTSHFSPSTSNRYLGVNARRWQCAYLVSSPNISSDLRLKENINYIEEDIQQPKYPMFIAIQKSNNECLSLSKMHNFIKNELKLVEYDYKNVNIDESSQGEGPIDTDSMRNRQIGFIAQDIVNTEVGAKIITKDEDGILGYESGNFTSVIAGALKGEIVKREILEEKVDILIEEIKKLKGAMTNDKQ